MPTDDLFGLLLILTGIVMVAIFVYFYSRNKPK